MAIKKIFFKKYLALFLLLAAVLALGPACTKKKIDGDLHLVMWENPKSFDPAVSSDAYAAEAIGNIYETLLQYHYLKRPYELTTLLAKEMPKYSTDGLTVTIPIKSKIFFQNDSCFKESKGRELIADDFIYSFKRLADPKILSEGWWVFDGKIKGLNEWREEAAKNGRADYSKSIEGFQSPDPYTLVIKLKKRYPQLNYILAMAFTVPIPHEAVDKYGAEFSNHPVGTGPYVLKEYTRGSRIVFERNPSFHGENFPARVTRAPNFECEPNKMTAECGVKDADYSDLDYGKPMPFTDRVVVHISLERQPAWLDFLRGNLDWDVIPKDSFSSTLNSDHKLKPEFADKGMILTPDDSTTEWFLGYNMEDPVVGGKSKFLRQAMGLAYNSNKEIELFTFGLSRPANQILPPSINGHLTGIPPRETNIEKAKALLVKAGYPEGKGLPKLFFDVEGSSQERQRGEFFKSQMAQIGINVEVRPNTRPELFEKKRKAKLQIHMDGWIADYPDAENFMQLLYGPNRPPGSNNQSFNNAEFNQLYEKMAGTSPGPKREKTIRRMTEIFLDESPWTPNWIAVLYHMHQGWMKNYIYSDFSYCNYKYYRVDLEKKKELLSKF